MTVVYHIETHRSPRQVERLVRTLVRGAPDALVVVDHDRSFEAPDPAVLARLGAHLRLSDGGYGDMTHIERWIATARWLMSEGIDFAYLSNLSGQDYPIRPLSAIHDDLAMSDVDAFIQSFAVMDTDETRWGVARGRTRYEFGHRRIRRLSHNQQLALRPLQAVNLIQPWLRVTASTALAWGLPKPSPWGDDLVLRGGSVFCTLSRAAVEAVLLFAAERPDVAQFLSGSIAPEEVYLQTALGWADAHRLIGRALVVDDDCRRYFDFSTSSLNHPRTFTRGDLPEVLGSGADFARKFDEARFPGVLDLIDAHVEQPAARQ